MGKKTPPCPVYPAWTTAKFWGFVRSGLRAKWLKWPARFDALNKAKRTVRNKRHKAEYKCAICGNWFKQSEVEVDHIYPVGSLNRFEDLPQFVERLFAPVEHLRIVCKPCHSDITHRGGADE